MTRRAFLQAGLALPLTRQGEATTPLSVVLTSGTVSDSWQGDPDTACFSIGHLTLLLPSAGIPAVRLRELVGQKMELVVRGLK